MRLSEAQLILWNCQNHRVSETDITFTFMSSLSNFIVDQFRVCVRRNAGRLVFKATSVASGNFHRNAEIAQKTISEIDFPWGWPSKNFTSYMRVSRVCLFELFVLFLVLHWSHDPLDPLGPLGPLPVTRCAWFRSPYSFEALACRICRTGVSRGIVLSVASWGHSVPISGITFRTLLLASVWFD